MTRLYIETLYKYIGNLYIKIILKKILKNLLKLNYRANKRKMTHLLNAYAMRMHIMRITYSFPFQMIKQEVRKKLSFNRKYVFVIGSFDSIKLIHS